MLLRALILMLIWASPAMAQAKGQLEVQKSVAFFGLTFLDTSLQGSTYGSDPAERARVIMLEDMVRARFADAGYELVDLAPVAVELDRIVNPAKCYGCDSRMTTKLGADYALVGEIQKVSNLILSMNLQLRDSTTGKIVQARAVDIRSNTDESWRRGMAYILRNTFFREEEE
ncbi:DUF3280 domain-containing protein [Celeribacter neptunius]|uniref:DUF2380 domain-containing protein n=1 Tax=Celeribacter neptunius TaxID=588602 RepID=A0A1I3Y929_9RHOB|nr:DUF3280 domain-containing protein [Celeribacter neptunius]SFK28273.1 Protein of unknown function [Celeribacter neptunius]